MSEHEVSGRVWRRVAEAALLLDGAALSVVAWGNPWKHDHREMVAAPSLAAALHALAFIAWLVVSVLESCP